MNAEITNRGGDAFRPEGEAQHQFVSRLADTATFTEWMAFEEEEVPAEWRAALDEAYANATRDLPRRVDLRRQGPQDLGGLVREMADAFEEGGADGYRQAHEVAAFRERVAALELVALDALPEGGKTADLSFLDLARSADCTKDLSYEARRKAAEEASYRLAYEVDEMEIDRLDVRLEAKARHPFLQSVTEFLEEALSRKE
ncbi:MAG: hypothetical protein AAF845_16835 [Bacteroidota bacterium]